MTQFTPENWENAEGRYWTTLFNTISGPRSAVLIGTQNVEGIGNIGLFNSLVHIGAKPPLLGFILRPTTVRRDTYENILENKHYTVNLISEPILDQAHQTSAKYDAEQDEFNTVGLEKEFIADFEAPFVKVSPIKLGLTLVEEHLIKKNGTRLIVGEIKLVDISPDLIHEDGSVNTTKAQTILASGLSAYHTHQFLTKKEYAKP